MSQEHYCLKWNLHNQTILSEFDVLYSSQEMTDCILISEGLPIKVHKIVLCACSPYFKKLLDKCEEKCPLVIFNDITFSELRCIVEYMYRGEVNIEAEELQRLLDVANSLQIKGLTEEDSKPPLTSNYIGQGDFAKVSKAPMLPPPPKRKAESPRTSMVKKKHKPPSLSPIHNPLINSPKKERVTTPSFSHSPKKFTTPSFPVSPPKRATALSLSHSPKRVAPPSFFAHSPKKSSTPLPLSPPKSKMNNFHDLFPKSPSKIMQNSTIGIKISPDHLSGFKTSSPARSLTPLLLPNDDQSIDVTDLSPVKPSVDTLNGDYPDETFIQENNTQHELDDVHDLTLDDDDDDRLDLKLSAVQNGNDTFTESNNLTITQNYQATQNGSIASEMSSVSKSAVIHKSSQGSLNETGTGDNSTDSKTTGIVQNSQVEGKLKCKENSKINYRDDRPRNKTYQSSN